MVLRPIFIQVGRRCHGMMFRRIFRVVFSHPWGPGFSVGILGKKSSFPGVGPLDNSVIFDHAVRLSNLSDRLEANGFLWAKVVDGAPRVTILVSRENSRRLIVESGTHRVAVAKSLDLDALPMQVARVIRECEVKTWPGVTSGAVEENLALEFFHSFFIPGGARHICRINPWCNG